MDPEFWTVVVNGSANLFIAAAAILQVILLCVTLKIGSNFLNDHKEKVKVERQRLCIEEAFRAMYRIEQTLKVLFLDFDVRSLEEYTKAVQWINSQTAPLELAGFSEINSILKIRYCFLYKTTTNINVIGDCENNLLLNLEFIDNLTLEEAGKDYINVCASIISFMNQDFYYEFIRTDSMTNYYNELVANFPINLDDDSKPLIKEYNRCGLILREKMKLALRKP